MKKLVFWVLLFSTLLFLPACEATNKASSTTESNSVETGELPSTTKLNGEETTSNANTTCSANPLYGIIPDVPMEICGTVVSEVTKTTDDTIYTLNTNQTDSLRLEDDFINSDFLESGLGIVEYVSSVDGDTTWFRVGSSEAFKVRYLYIDTPETHNGEDPWGLAASRYTKSVLESAIANGGNIVVESANIGSVPKIDTYGRYLGFVWYQPAASAEYRLLNLEIVEMAYSKLTVASGKYFDYFRSGSLNAMGTGERVYNPFGDPEYDYEEGKFK